MVFALDIGTRSIVGLIGAVTDDSFSVTDHEQRFHKSRAMRDGQIEDINLVARTTREIKEALEERNGIKLTNVSIAAAGRSLKTIRSFFEQDINEEEAITPELMRGIEYSAISAALDVFAAEDGSGFSCVGYDVVSCRLDGYPMDLPVGHKGSRIAVEVLAAFLPFSVIRSLYSVTDMCGLTVESLTLEPIAAINAVVPKDVRLLNIAIADIGAGTSDIGISKGGSIVAYDMVTIAGDEVTETIMKHYLVDFNTGEKIKFMLSEDGEKIAFTDILGMSHSCSKEAVMGALNPIIENLCDAIAESIIRINDGPPTALFLVGGGSQIPGLCAKMAGKLNMPAERVTLGGKMPYRNITLYTDSLLTPEFVTPIGIGATSRLTHIQDLFSVTVNGEKISLPGAENMKVLDALLIAGVKARDLIGRAPAPLIYYINGEKKTARGIPSIPGSISVNKEPASLDSPIRQGDEITVVFAQHGIPPKLLITDAVKPLDEAAIAVTVNGKRVKNNYHIKNGDMIAVTLDSGGENQEPAPEPDSDEVLTVKPAPEVKEPVKQLTEIKVSVNENWVQIPVEEGETPLFLDMLNFVSIDTKNAKGDLVLSLNGSPATYTDTVRDGDKVTIKWSE